MVKQGSPGCAGCHSSRGPQGGCDLGPLLLRAAAAAGAVWGPAVVGGGQGLVAAGGRVQRCLAPGDPGVLRTAVEAALVVQLSAGWHHG